MEVADKADELENNLSVLTELDLIMAKARLGRRLKGIVPGVNTKGYIHLKKARHPLIPIEEAVPNDVELGREYQAMVITGPNTGREDRHLENGWPARVDGSIGIADSGGRRERSGDLHRSLCRYRG